MTNRKIVLGTAISGLLAIVTVITVTDQLVKSQAPTAETTIANTNINFTHLFKEKFKTTYSLPLDAVVIYQSPSTVVLEGEKLTLNGLKENQYLWQGVDLVKQQGYTIDSVMMSGQGTENNPYFYHVIARN